MKSTKKTEASSKVNNNESDINPIENPVGAIDFFMPLPDEVYNKWKKDK